MHLLQVVRLTALGEKRVPIVRIILQKISAIARRKMKETRRYLLSVFLWDLLVLPRALIHLTLSGLVQRYGNLKVLDFVVLEILCTRLPQFTRGTPKYFVGLASRAKSVSVRMGDAPRIEYENHDYSSEIMYLQDGSDRESVFSLISSTSLPVVIVCGEDMTFPRQRDKRYPTFDHLQPRVEEVGKSLGSKLVFAEQLDSNSRFFHPFPGGVMPHHLYGGWRVAKAGSFVEMPESGVIALLSQRVREGPQWETRRMVGNIAKTHWSDFVFFDEREVNASRWRKLASRFFFGLCVEGGGISPSPKFFELLLQKTIPIIRASDISEVHQKMPCVVVDDWHPDLLSRSELAKQYKKIAGEWLSWDHVFDRLTMDFWEHYALAARNYPRDGKTAGL